MEFVAGQQNLPHLCSGDSLTSVHSIFSIFILTRYHVNSIGYGVCFLLQKPGDLVLAEVLIVDHVCAITLVPSLEVLVQSIFMTFIYHFDPLKNCELCKTFNFNSSPETQLLIYMIVSTFCIYECPLLNNMQNVWFRSLELMFASKNAFRNLISSRR